MQLQIIDVYVCSDCNSCLLNHFNDPLSIMWHSFKIYGPLDSAMYLPIAQKMPFQCEMHLDERKSYSSAMIIARFNVLTTKDMDVGNSLICGKYHIFCCKQVCLIQKNKVKISIADSYVQILILWAFCGMVLYSTQLAHMPFYI